MPPFKVVAPVYVLEAVGRSVNVPAPTLVSARLVPLTEVSVPVKTEFVKSSRPKVRTAAVALEFVTVPLPASEPIVWEKALRLTVLPALTVTLVWSGVTLATPKMSWDQLVPLPTVVEPP